jgi:hypothetical protein
LNPDDIRHVQVIENDPIEVVLANQGTWSCLQVIRNLELTQVASVRIKDIEERSSLPILDISTNPDVCIVIYKNTLKQRFTAWNPRIIDPSATIEERPESLQGG